MRRAARVDANQQVIVNAFRTMGCSVDCTNDKWDLTVGYGGITRIVEIKDGNKPKSRQQLTPREKEFHGSWTGGIYLIRNVDDVVACVASMRKWANILREKLIDV